MTPVPNLTDADVAFSGDYRKLLPKWEELSDEEKRGNGPYCDAVSSLFFKGGKLADHGIVPKSGIELAKVMRYLRATLGDWGPRHEHKIGGIAHRLKEWCDYKPELKKD